MKKPILEHEKAAAWRRARGLSQAQLGKLTGFSPSAVYWMEKGATANRPGYPSRPVRDWVWLRYRRACQGVDAELNGRQFNWGL